MQKKLARNWRSSDVLISFFVLGFLLWYTYGLLFEAPYAGFYFNPSDGKILEIYKAIDPASDLKKDDYLVQVGSITWDEYHNNRELDFFDNVQPGQVIEITVRRGSEAITTAWAYAGINRDEFVARFFNVWWLAYIFWFFGMATQIVMRPKDLHWRLLVASNYLMGIFILLGSFSAWHIWLSSTLLHATAWLILPVFLHFHWVFPTPLRNLKNRVWNTFYIVCFGMAAAELFLLAPRQLYFIAILLALVGSIGLLVLHFIRHPNQRSQIRALAIGALLALLPTIGVSLLGSIGRIPHNGPLSILALPILPAFYFYAAYRHNLGGMELRSNRVISVYAYLILLGTLLLLLIGLIGPAESLLRGMSIILAVVATFSALLTILIFPAFQAFIEQRVLGIRLPYQHILETYSTRTITSETLPDLLKLLSEDVFPSLFVRQYAFVGITGGSKKVLLFKDVDQPQALEDAADIPLPARTDSLIPSFSETRPFGWVRVILPLKVGDELLGLWLLGRRDPDDFYSQAELPTLQSFANQTAIALSNLLQTERLTSMYQANADRYERERHRLALDLHDSVLNEMAALLMILDPAAQTPEFQKAYDSLSQRLREIVSELRPPMLNFGLKLALEELADNLMDRNRDMVQVNVAVRGEEVRYSQSVEHHIYRMAQEACENSIRHGQARHVMISGELTPEHLNLTIEDDGSGFDASSALRLDHLLAHKHFGLAGMVERTLLIGADVNIQSVFSAGTRISIHWSPSR